MSDTEKREALTDEELKQVSGGSNPEAMLEAAGANHTLDLEKPGERDPNLLQ